MKIKSVKITGFRAFEKEVDATFDFTSNGEIMNFASIYAPNGFGKTSFYDAIEWGVTQKIQRFDRMIDFEKVRKDNDGSILLNKFSSNGKVTVLTDKKPFENVINNRKKYDYKAKAVNEYFQNQILTQDLIDAFLKEEKADKRYENFLEINENLKNYDSIYKKINRLLDYIKEERKVLEKRKLEEEKSLQTEIDFEQEFKKFDEINGILSFLKNNGENFEIIDQRFYTKTTYENLSRNIDVRLHTLEQELNKSKLYIEKIILARDGEINIDGKLKGGILSYFEDKSKITDFNKQLEQLDKVLTFFAEKEKLKNEVGLNDERVKDAQIKLEKALDIQKRFESFNDARSKIAILQKGIEEIKNNSHSENNKKVDLERKRAQLDNKRTEINNFLEKNQIILNKIPSNKILLDNTLQTIIDLEKKIEELSNSITDEQIKQNILNDILNQFKYYESVLDDDIGLLLEFDLFTGQNDLINIYISGLEHVEQAKIKIENIQSQIDTQNHFNKELGDLINKGLEIINKTERKDCPLCNHDHESFSKLSERILANRSLDSLIKDSLQKKNNAEIELNYLKGKLSADKKVITNNLLSLKEKYVKDHHIIQTLLGKLVSDKEESLEKLNTNQAILKDVNTFFGEEQKPEKLFEKLNDESSKNNNDLLAFTSEIESVDIEILKILALIKNYADDMKISEQDIKNQESEIDFIEVSKYFRDILKSNNFSKDVLLEHISSLNKLIRDITEIIKKNHLSIEEYSIKLVDYQESKVEYLSRKSSLQNERSFLSRVVEKFENYVSSEFNFKISTINKEDITKQFNNIIEKEKKNEAFIEDKIEKFKITNILNKACNEATESKIIKDRINEIILNLKELDSAEKKLIDEKTHLKAFLKSTIEAYFYTPLINAIYEKIDPHPEYKEIEFECDFAENKPRLQIYTISLGKNNSKIKSVPSLYFSTAQVNILSLSIFLARALKTKDENGEKVECIFIDDPIQSMDSINILSFIDLFRGLTLSLERQLIVSTHEENFHLLLQKKIPINLFKSKFLEFETFGKLKN